MEQNENEKPTSAILPDKNRKSKTESEGDSDVTEKSTTAFESDGLSDPKEEGATTENKKSTTAAEGDSSSMTEESKTTENKTSTTAGENDETEEGATATTDKDLADDDNDQQLQEAIALSLTDLHQTDGAVKQEGETSHSKAVLVDQIKGVLYGNCIGDAIGLLTEFMDKKEAQKNYGVNRLMRLFNTQNLEYSQKVYDRHRCNWEEGDWTDDSDQMILILRTLVQNRGEFVERDFAKKLKHWVYHGYEELGDTGGCGLGRTTASVLSHRQFLSDPHKAARDVWEGSGRFIAPNGGVMRTSILGTMKFHDLNKVIANTKRACMVTHADPRCVASCVAVTIAIALMLQRKHVFNNGEHDVDAIMVTAHKYAEREIEDPNHKEELMYHMFAESLDKLQLDESRTIGYTLKCMGAGFWGLRQKDFREAIQAITMEAGDADTNCAVAGALLGCKVGFSKLPESWVTGLYHRKWLDNEIESYLKLLGLHQEQESTGEKK